jgi:ATP-dependent helicase HrpB
MIILPIETHLPEIASRLRTTNSLILTAPPGAGKTTRLPPFLHNAGFSRRGEIIILEPRRPAARLAAARVAGELGEKPGETVGYSLRFENVAGPQTRIRFMTEAILARRIIHDPHLDGVSVVILDEFHERHLATDLALAFLKRLQERNPTISIIVMSATLDIAPVADYLSGAAILSLDEPPFHTEIEYEAAHDHRPLEMKVSAAVTRLFQSGNTGDILVFLPGSSEIRGVADALHPASKRFNFHLHFLHGNQPSLEQQRALEPADKIKVILSTNIAETSVTIPGITVVIDSGLARISGHSTWSGFPTLATAKISKSSAIQRAGRAGRTGAGQVMRLYTKQDYESRPDHDIPEICRSDLAETSLVLHGIGIHDIRSFQWFEAPPDAALEAAETLLGGLGAIDANGRITETGLRMLAFPVHPRIARMIVEGERMGIADEAALLSSLLSERDIRLGSRARISSGMSAVQTQVDGPSDLLELRDRYREAEKTGFNAEHLRSLGVDFRAVHTARQGYRQLRRLLKKPTAGSCDIMDETQIEEALLITALSAFPDRVARRRKTGSRELLLSGGGSAQLSPASVVRKSEFMVAVDVEERKEKGSLRMSGTRVRLASAIEVEWLAALYPDAITQKTELLWNEKAGRVEEVRQTCYEKIPLEESTRTAPESRETARILASVVESRGIPGLHEGDSFTMLKVRLSLASSHFPAENWPELDESAIRQAIIRMCEGKRRLDELTSSSFIENVMEIFSDRQRRLLIKETPDRIRLRSGRTVRIQYESSKPPWIASRLQDFFGTFTTPSICTGRVPLTLHLLAPNGRAVQVTQDLSGFWQKHYPGIRRELQRRYPKHAWPLEVP